MTIFNEIGSGFKSLGSWIESRVIKPISNKVTPIIHTIATPIRTTINISEDLKKMI